MKTRLREFVLLLVLVGMSLQGMAATLSVLYCHGGANAHASNIDGGHHGSQQDERDTSTHANDHLCSHLTVSAPSFVRPLSVLPDFPVQAFVPDPLHDLFVPDRPQRPPLA
jgi:hypothetical protein